MTNMHSDVFFVVFSQIHVPAKHSLLPSVSLSRTRYVSNIWSERNTPESLKCTMRGGNMRFTVGQSGKSNTKGEQEAGIEGEIIKASWGDKVSESNLATCDPISTATLCVCTEHFVSFGTH